MTSDPNWFNDMLNREPDFVYTNDDALADGIHQYVAEGVAVTDTVAGLHPDPAERERFALELSRLYRAGVYLDPIDPDWVGDANKWLAFYKRDGVEYYIQDAGPYLVVMRPQDR